MVELAVGWQRRSSRATAVSNTLLARSHLAHEVGNDAMERAALEVKGLAGLAGAFLTGAQRPEIFSGLRSDVRAELQATQAPYGW